MTKKDESPEEATNPPYWSDELLAVLAEALGDEESKCARELARRDSCFTSPPRP